MGICQRKCCEKLVAQIIVEKTGLPLEQILSDTRRAPVRHIEASVFLKGCV